MKTRPRHLANFMAGPADKPAANCPDTNALADRARQPASRSWRKIQKVIEAKQWVVVGRRSEFGAVNTLSKQLLLSIGGNCGNAIQKKSNPSQPRKKETGAALATAAAVA
jgi:hypothetical protein